MSLDDAGGCGFCKQSACRLRRNGRAEIRLARSTRLDHGSCACSRLLWLLSHPGSVRHTAHQRYLLWKRLAWICASRSGRLARQTVESAPGEAGYSSIALDPSGFPRISYYFEDGTNAGDLKYAYQDQDGWHTEAIYPWGVAPELSSLAVDFERHTSRRLLRLPQRHAAVRQAQPLWLAGDDDQQHTGRRPVQHAGPRRVLLSPYRLRGHGSPGDEIRLPGCQRLAHDGPGIVLVPKFVWFGRRSLRKAAHRLPSCKRDRSRQIHHPDCQRLDQRDSSFRPGRVLPADRRLVRSRPPPVRYGLRLP